MQINVVTEDCQNIMCKLKIEIINMVMKHNLHHTGLTSYILVTCMQVNLSYTNSVLIL